MAEPPAPLQRPSRPLRDGVAASRVELPRHGLEAWPTLLDFLAWRFAHIPHAEWLARMQRGDVLDMQGHPVAPDVPCQAQARYDYFRASAPEAVVASPEHIVYEDERIVVADKPHFLSVIPAGRHVHETLLVRLRKRLGIATLAPAHRIDHDTAGLVLFTKQANQRAAYQALFRKRAVTKYYEAVAPWRAELAATGTTSLTLRHCLVPGTHFMQMQALAPDASHPANAETRLQMLERDGPWAHYRLHAITGQKHQLRVQMAALGAPLRNDRLYPVLLPDGPPNIQLPLQLLARQLAFTDPITGLVMAFESRRRLVWPIPHTP